MGTMGWGASRGAARITLTYVLLSGCWVLVSDWGIEMLFQDTQNAVVVQTVKGLSFVTLTGLVIFWLVRREERRLASANEDLERTLQHAMVLHRVLRHNLRNSCDVIQNNVELLRSGRGNAADSCERIQRQTANLSAIATKSQHLRDVVFGDETERTEQDLVAVVEEAADGARQSFPEARFVVEPSPPQPVLAHPRLSVAVEELLANAVVHQTATDPTVTASFEREGTEAVLSIADDGPGIPDGERVVLEDGVEDALCHSRGVGLWVVRFIVTVSGGSMTVPSTGSEGTVVSIRLPVADG